MANNVKKEFELYEPMRKWLQMYLEEKYVKSQVITIDSHARTLDVFLEELGVIEYYPQVVGLDIQIDVLGIIKNSRSVKISFIEAFLFFLYASTIFVCKLKSNSPARPVILFTKFICGASRVNLTVSLITKLLFISE